MSNKEKYPYLNNVWKIMCDEYGLPKGTPMPDLPNVIKEVEIADYWAKFLTMGQITKWLESKSFHCNSTLLKVMNTMWKELDNV